MSIKNEVKYMSLSLSAIFQQKTCMCTLVVRLTDKLDGRLTGCR